MPLSIRSNPINYFLLLIPLFIFYGIFCHFLSNVPYIDDFSWYFTFINKFNETESFQNRLNSFLEPYNNHRHYFQRILIVAFVATTGKINIAFFIIVGNIFFLSFLALIVQKNNLLGAVALAWLAFQPISFLNYYTFAFFNFPVFLFALLCIRLMVKQADLKWIILLGLLATFSNGNGLLVWIIGILISFLQKDYKRLIIYGSALGALVLFYVLQVSQANYPRAINAELILNSFLYFIQIHAYFVDWPDYTLPWIPLLIGTGLLVLLGYFLVRHKSEYYKTDKSYLLVYLVFLSLSMALISCLRSSVNGITANLIDHYKIYPCIFFGCFIYYSTDQLKLAAIWRYSLVVVSIIIGLINYSTYLPLMYSHFANQMADALNYRANGKWLSFPVIQGKKEYAFVNDVSKRIVEKGFYAGIELSDFEKNNLYEAQIDTVESNIVLTVNQINYSPFTEKAFFVVNCSGLHYHFPVWLDRSWKDVLKLKLQQDKAYTVISWNALNEPCLDRPDKIQLALLKKGALTYYPLSFVPKNLPK